MATGDGRARILIPGFAAQQIHRHARNSNRSPEFCRPRFAHLARNVNNGEAPVNTNLFANIANIVNIANVAGLACAGMTVLASSPARSSGPARASAA